MGYLLTYSLWNQQGEIITSTVRIGLGEDSHRLGAGRTAAAGGRRYAPRPARGGPQRRRRAAARRDRRPAGCGWGYPTSVELFPNTDEENRGRDSAEMLRIAYARVQSAGYQIVNLDCVISAEEPKLSPLQGRHSPTSCRRSWRVSSNRQVNLKAKTGEGVGPVGEQDHNRSPLRGFAGTDVRTSDREQRSSVARSRLSIYEYCIYRQRSTQTNPATNPHRSPAASTTRSRSARSRSARSSRARSASTSAGPRSTTRPTSATWSGR